MGNRNTVRIVPPTLNLVNPDAAAEGLDLVGPSAREMPVEYALSNGFGFGGVNASVLFRRWKPALAEQVGGLA